MTRRRCGWPGSDPLMMAYHDDEWGVPVHDDRKLFEFMILDAFQAGLSWSTILRKRDHFRKAFANFEPATVARFNSRSKERLLTDAGIVRNRLKIEAAISNARQFLRVQDANGSFDRYIWQFVGGTPIQNGWRSIEEIPAKTRESEEMSKALKAEGFRFVGSTICYAFMQAAGMVNDHEVTCFRHPQLQLQVAGRRRGR